MNIDGGRKRDMGVFRFHFIRDGAADVIRQLRVPGGADCNANWKGGGCDTADEIAATRPVWSVCHPQCPDAQTRYRIDGPKPIP